ncbi:MAG TPA: glycine cleavage system protein GcvH [Alcanivoracaceae bacterium]|nr:glycine cleavage system protein GcvH [Alcanivoracaceae bacterium]
MSELRDELRYLSTHEWVRTEDDGTVVVGITDFAQDALGDVVYADLPEEGAEFVAGDEVAVLESVKAASDIYTPISGTIVRVNEALEDEPELINDSPYDEGWLFAIEPGEEAEAELAALLTADEYREQTEE